MRRLGKMTPVASTRTLLVVAVVAAALWTFEPATADDSSGQLWLISTRCAPCCCPSDTGRRRIAYWRLKAGRQWLGEDENAFLAGSGDPPAPTAIFIHGNRTDRCEAVRKGRYVFGLLKREAAGRPFRLVIWSWPADRIRGRNRRDVRVKAAYSDVQSYYLAECLHRFDPDVPVSLIGYSFGARVITGALHILAGGKVAGHALAERTAAEPADAKQRPIRAVLIAAALDCDWLLPRRRNGLALSQVDHVLVTRNCCDPVLRWYPLMYGRGGPQAMGYTGAACYAAADGGCDKIELVDVSCSVGRIHDWQVYLSASGLRRRLGWYGFLESAKPKAVP